MQGCLSSAVPRPLATREAETFVVVADDRDNNVVAALFPVIPCRRPEPGNVARAAAPAGNPLGSFRGNVLVVGDRVNGVLDLAFASPDLRAMISPSGAVRLASQRGKPAANGH